MKPRTRIQKEIVGLAKRLPKPTESQTAYAFEHCFKHYAHRTKGGIITCTECGHRWKSKHQLAESICGCTCPHCGKELEILDTRKRVFRENAYYSVITTRKGYQVVRYFMARATFKVGQPAKYSLNEVVQWWFAPSGKSEIIARLRSMHTLYYDMWNEWSDMELRGNKNHKAYDIGAYKTYPTIKVIPELKRNGFNGDLHNITPQELFTSILTDSRAETLLKAGHGSHLRYFIAYPSAFNECWHSYKIALRRGYTINDISMWCDHIHLLRHFGKDIRNPHFICPADLNSEHNRLIEKRNIQREREQAEIVRQWEHQRIERERKRLERIEKDKAAYIKDKANFLNLTFTDGILLIHVLQNVDEFEEEGKAMHHCVFANAYYNRTNSLILSATIDGVRIETIEVSLQTFQVVQSYGVCNQNTEYHDRIINLVDSNMSLIRKRMRKAA